MLENRTTSDELIVLSIHFGRDSEVGTDEHNGGLMIVFTVQLFQVLIETLDKLLRYTVSQLPHA